MPYYILKRCWPRRRTSFCYLCLNKKLLLNTKETNLQIKEMNLSLSVDTKVNSTLWIIKLDHCVKISVFGTFSWCKFFPTFGLNMETYRVNPRIHSDVEKCRPGQPCMQTLFMLWTSGHCYVILMPFYYKFTVISWLN